MYDLRTVVYACLDSIRNRHNGQSSSLDFLQNVQLNANSARWTSAMLFVERMNGKNDLQKHPTAKRYC